MTTRGQSGSKRLPFARWTDRLIVLREFTALLHEAESDEGGFWATCLEVPGANGQGESREDCLQDPAAAVQLILDINEEEAFRVDP